MSMTRKQWLEENGRYGRYLRQLVWNTTGAARQQVLRMRVDALIDNRVRSASYGPGWNWPNPTPRSLGSAERIALQHQTQRLKELLSMLPYPRLP